MNHELAFVPAEIDADPEELRRRARSRSRPRGYSVSGPDVDRDGFDTAAVALNYALTVAMRRSANPEPCDYYVREPDTADGLYRVEVTHRQALVHTIREEN